MRKAHPSRWAFFMVLHGIRGNALVAGIHSPAGPVNHPPHQPGGL